MGVTSSSSSPAIVAAPQRAFLQALPQRLAALAVAVDELRGAGAVPGEQVVLQRRLTAMADAAAVLELDALSTAFAGAESALCRDPEGPTTKDLDAVADTLALVPSLLDDLAPVAEADALPQDPPASDHSQVSSVPAEPSYTARSQAPVAAGSLEARVMALAADAATAELPDTSFTSLPSAVAPRRKDPVNCPAAEVAELPSRPKQSIRSTLVGFPPAPADGARFDALAGREVLLAHSDPALLRRVGGYLVSVGVELRQVSGGEHLWTELQRRSPELLLCARELPSLDADQLRREMERDPLLRDVPTVFLDADASLRQRYGEGQPRGRGLSGDAPEDEVLGCCEELLSPLTQLEEQLIHRAPVWGAQSSFTPHRVLGLTGRHVRHAEVIFQEGELELRAVLRGGRLSSLRSVGRELDVTGNAALPLLLGLRTGRFELIYEPELHGRDREARVDPAAEHLLAEHVSRVRRGLVWLQAPHLSRIERVELDEQVVQHCLQRAPSIVGKLAEQLNAGVAPKVLLSGVSATVLETVLLDLAARGAVRSVRDLGGVDCLDVEPTFAEGCPSADLLTPAHSAAMAVEMIGAEVLAQGQSDPAPSAAEEVAASSTIEHPEEPELHAPRGDVLGQLSSQELRVVQDASPQTAAAAPETSALAQLRGSRAEPAAPSSASAESRPPTQQVAVVAGVAAAESVVQPVAEPIELAGPPAVDDRSPNALADFLAAAEPAVPPSAEAKREGWPSDNVPVSASPSRVGAQRLAQEEGTELGQWVLQHLSEQPSSSGTKAGSGRGEVAPGTSVARAWSLPEEETASVETTPSKVAQLPPRRRMRRQLEWARTRARSLITQSRALLESAASSGRREPETASKERPPLDASDGWSEPPAGPGLGVPELDAEEELEAGDSPSVPPESAVPTDFPDQGMDCPRLVERPKRWRVPQPVAAAALPVLVLCGTAAAGYAVMEGLQERLPLIRGLEGPAALAQPPAQGAGPLNVGPPGSVPDIAPPGSKQAAVLRSAPELVVTTIPLPPGIAVAAGKGLLEVYTADRQRIYVDGVFVGRGPARRVPLKTGMHELVTRTDESETRLEFEMSESQRTRIQPALHAANN